MKGVREPGPKRSHLGRGLRRCGVGSETIRPRVSIHRIAYTVASCYKKAETILEPNHGGLSRETLLSSDLGSRRPRGRLECRWGKKSGRHYGDFDGEDPDRAG